MSTHARSRLASLFGRELSWVRPELFKREHQLVVDGETLAVMQFRGFRSAFATTPTGRWYIDGRGIVGINAELRDAAQQPVLALRSRFWKRTLELSDGRVYRYRGFGFLALNQELRDNNDQPILRCAHAGPFSSKRGTLEILAPGVSNPLLEPLALISWYLVTRMRQRAAAHGAG